MFPEKLTYMKLQTFNTQYNTQYNMVQYNTQYNMVHEESCHGGARQAWSAAVLSFVALISREYIACLALVCSLSG